MKAPENLYYKKTHEWVEFLPDGLCRVGITDFAQAAMGDIVFVNIPAPGDRAAPDEPLCDIESVKAVSDVLSPVSGTIKEVNEKLVDCPELLNNDPYGEWIAVIETQDGHEGLMSAEEYVKFCESEARA